MVFSNNVKHMENTTEYQQWKKSRDRNAYISCFLLFMAGLETSAVSVVMLYYIQDRFKFDLDQARLYFSFAEMFNAVGQILGGIYIGRYTDKTRNLRLVVLVNLWATVIGNLMYGLPYHILLIIAGRFICGLNESLQVAFSGKCLIHFRRKI